MRLEISTAEIFKDKIVKLDLKVSRRRQSFRGSLDRREAGPMEGSETLLLSSGLGELLVPFSLCSERVERRWKMDSRDECHDKWQM